MIAVTITMTPQQLRDAMGERRPVMMGLADVWRILDEMIPEGWGRPTRDDLADFYMSADQVARVSPFTLPDGEAMVYLMTHGDGPFSIELTEVKA